MMAVMAKEKRDELSRLVKEKRAELGFSLARVVEESEDPDLNPSWVNRLENGQLREVPGESRLESLAKGLRLPYQVIAKAAGMQFMGIEPDRPEWSSDGSVQAVVARMGELDEQGRRDLAELAEIFARRYAREQ
jgi:hypothetical protein